MNKLVRPLTAGGLFLLALLVLPVAAATQPLPTPADFVRNLDLRCYKIGGPALGAVLRLDHLNPVLAGLAPEIGVNVGPPQELCVAVYKNDIPPSPTSFPFIRYVDWKCYAIAGAPLNLPLMLTQLNPVISGLLGGGINVIVKEPKQLCVPVQKDGSAPPFDVRALIKWLDVKCYNIEAGPSPSGTVRLTHINPAIPNFIEAVSFLGPPNPVQLCVPVKKNLMAPPPAILNVIKYADVLCYRITGMPLNRGIHLTHLNPVLDAFPAEDVFVTDSTKLCVPVAKNGVFPPG